MTPGNASTSDQDGKRIFVKSLNWIGDAVMATPALSLLRRKFPEAHITVMVRPWVAPVYEHNPDINELWVENEKASTGAMWRAMARVRRGRFDIGIALPNSIRSAMLLRGGRIPTRIGYRRGYRAALLNGAVPVDPAIYDVHQVYYYLKLLEPLCGKDTQPARMTLNPGSLEAEECDRWLRERGLDRGQRLIGMAPGSINSTAKRWLAERFAALADRLVDEETEVILIGSPAEAEVLDQVQAGARAALHRTDGVMGLGQAIALMNRLNGLVCNDAGAMHLAAALGVPTAAIFGPTEWHATYPFSPFSIVVRKQGVDCAPCMLRECPIDHRCMTGIRVEHVLEALERMMNKAGQTDPGKNPDVQQLLIPAEG